VHEKVRQREGASGISTCMRKGAFRGEIQFVWILVIDPVARATRLCRSARTSVSCALQEGPRDHSVLHRCFKTVTRRKCILRQRQNRYFQKAHLV